MKILIDAIKEHKMVEKSMLFKRGEVIASPGEIDTSIYWIKSGTIKVSMFDNEEERIVRFGYQNDLVVMLDSFISNQPTDFLMQTIKKTEVDIISQKKWTDFWSQDIERFKIWNQLLEQLVLQQVEREKDLLITSPQERLQRVMQRSPQLFQKIPKKHIASYLRMSPETLSRIKNID